MTFIIFDIVITVSWSTALKGFSTYFQKFQNNSANISRKKGFLLKVADTREYRPKDWKL